MPRRSSTAFAAADIAAIEYACYLDGFARGKAGPGELPALPPTAAGSVRCHAARALGVDDGCKATGAIRSQDRAKATVDDLFR